MSGWVARRFWTRVEVAERDTGAEVLLDGRPLRTPARAPLALPARPLADAVAAEWDAAEGEIRPDRMPVTRAVNSAVDRVMPQRGAVVDMLAEYGGSDLLCYRAEAPEALVRRQAEVWEPWLDWAEGALGAPLVRVAGVMPAQQPARSLARLRAALDDHDAFELTALHDLVTLSGSLVLALAVSHRAAAPGDAWAASRVDEAWQEAQWGRDAEAAARTAAREAAFQTAARILRLARGEAA